MILPPEQAKQKVCPFTRSAEFPGAPEAKCLADGCMAWRWAVLRSPQEYAERKSTLPYTPEPAGFCGATSG